MVEEQQPSGLPPEEFKDNFRRKGWTGSTLSERWGRTANRISVIGSDPGRELYWDDAVAGLPAVSDTIVEQQTQRLSPDEFKACFRRKGWTGALLSERWGRSANRISVIGSDPCREAYWDDAVRGLPMLNDGSHWKAKDVHAGLKVRSVGGDEVYLVGVDSELESRQHNLIVISLSTGKVSLKEASSGEVAKYLDRNRLLALDEAHLRYGGLRQE